MFAGDGKDQAELMAGDDDVIVTSGDDTVSQSDTEPTPRFKEESDFSITDVTELSATENFSFMDNDPEPKSKIPRFETEDWFNSKCFRRYWKHYYQVMAWCQKHYQYVYDHHGYQGSYGYQPQFSQYWGQPGVSGYQAPYCGGRGRGRGRKLGAEPASDTSKTSVTQSGRGRGRSKAEKRKRSFTKPGSDDVIPEEMSVDAESEGTCNTEDTETAEIELTEDMLRFFSHTLEHRKQRDEQKKETLEREKEEQHVNIESVHGKMKERTVSAPKERPGSRRTAEMKLLYGKGAAMIHGMETAVQMTFDRNTDVKQSKLWPNMPLKPIFS